MHNEFSDFITQFDAVFRDGPWYGDPVLTILKDINPDMAARKPLPDCHSIMEIVAHMVQWHRFVLKRLEGDTLFNISREAEDWPPVNTGENDSWPEMLRQLTDTRDNIVKAVKGKGEGFLSERVAQREYDFRYLLLGIIQHDIYHSAQIAMLKKQLKG